MLSIQFVDKQSRIACILAVSADTNQDIGVSPVVSIDTVPFKPIHAKIFLFYKNDVIIVNIN